MAALIARVSVPRTSGSVLSFCSRTARLGGIIGATTLLSANVLSEPIVPKTQCQGTLSTAGISDTVGGVAPRYQFTQADPSLRVSKGPVNFQQLSSGSVLGLITGYLTAKIGQLFLFSFGGFILLAAFLRYQGYIPSPWPFFRRILYLEADEFEGGELTAFLKKNSTFKAAFAATFMIGLLYS